MMRSKMMRLEIRLELELRLGLSSHWGCDVKVGGNSI